MFALLMLVDHWKAPLTSFMWPWGKMELDLIVWTFFVSRWYVFHMFLWSANYLHALNSCFHYFNYFFYFHFPLCLVLLHFILPKLIWWKTIIWLTSSYIFRALCILETSILKPLILAVLVKRDAMLLMEILVQCIWLIFLKTRMTELGHERMLMKLDEWTCSLPKQKKQKKKKEIYCDMKLMKV